MSRSRKRRLLLPLSGLLVALGALVLFPGRRLSLAWTIATGLGVESLQAHVDELEAKAIRGEAFTKDDKRFLLDFYGTLATGAKLTILVRQTGRLMDHYLAGSGLDYRLDAEIFTENTKVKEQASRLRTRAAPTPCNSNRRFSSPSFYMPDESKLDSVFGLYHGTLHLDREESADGTCLLRFRAEVPWQWPSYESLKAKYGKYHAESFPLPNMKAFLLGREHALFVDNGLGEHLAQLGLAKPFLAYAEWTEH